MNQYFPVFYYFVNYQSFQLKESSGEEVVQLQEQLNETQREAVEREEQLQQQV